MLINLSNHPLSTWTEKQIETADKIYNQIIDLEFPLIPPDADEGTVTVLAEDYKNICIERLSTSKDKNNAVHIMGEMTFCFALVSLLLKENIECIASTTERLVTEENDIKTSKFDFVKFRKYKLF